MIGNYQSLENNINVIDLAILRLETLSFRAQKYIDSIIVEEAIRHILDPLKNLASSRRHAQSFIDSLEIIKLDFMRVGLSISLDKKTSNGIPINKLLEFGWSGPYEITFNPIGHWTGGSYGSGDHFAASVVHPGFQGYHLLDSLQNWGFVNRFAESIIQKTSDYLERTAFQ